MTRETFDLLIYAVIVLGLVLAARRLYQDFTRPLPDDETEAEAQPVKVETSKVQHKQIQKQPKEGKGR